MSGLLRAIETPRPRDHASTETETSLRRVGRHPCIAMETAAIQELHPRAHQIAPILPRLSRRLLVLRAQLRKGLRSRVQAILCLPLRLAPGVVAVVGLDTMRPVTSLVLRLVEALRHGEDEVEAAFTVARLLGLAAPRLDRLLLLHPSVGRATALPQRTRERSVSVTISRTCQRKFLVDRKLRSCTTRAKSSSSKMRRASCGR